MNGTDRTAVFLLALIVVGQAHATVVGGIIDTDTVWSDNGSPYTFNSTVQIAYGATLTIAPGVQVNGGTIQVFGTLIAKGSGANRPLFTGTTIAFGTPQNPADTGSITIDDAVLNSGSLYGATGNAIYGTLSLTNSVLHNAGPMYIWYPTSNVLIQGNQFLGSGGISVGTSGNVTVNILNNYFKNWTPTYNGDAAVVNWASYGSSETIVSRNTFASPGQVAVELPPGYDQAAMIATNNYWGTTNQTTIASMVYDNHVDLGSAGPITYLPYLTAPAAATPNPGPLSVSAFADYLGEGRAGYTVWRPSTGYWYSIDGAGDSATWQWGTTTDLPVVGDFDGDGKTDIAVWRPSTGNWYITPSSTGQVVVKQWGESTDIPVTGDFDGDGKTDVAVWRPSTGTWYITESSTGQVVVKQWGESTDIPVTGDFDGDGKTDIAVWRPSTGTWYITESSTDQVVVKQWGESTDTPVTGDFDGDGRTDIAVWRPSTGTWYIIHSSNGNGVSTQWGASGDVPVARDYDGDGKTDIAVWRPSTGTWYVIESGTQQTVAQQWGAAGDIPVNSLTH